MRSGATALVEDIGLLNHYRRYPFRDPDLPEPLLPGRWPGRRAHRVFTDCHDSLRAEAETFVSSVVGGTTGKPTVSAPGK